MWKKLWFRLGLRQALLALGIAPNTVPSALRQALVALGVAEGLNAREAALIIYFRTPAMRLFDAQLAQATVADWQHSLAVRKQVFTRAVRQDFPLPELPGVRESLFHDA